MTVNFPLVDERRYQSIYVPRLITNERVDIPSSPDNGYYYVQLKEVPDDRSKGSVSKPTISGMKEISSWPDRNQFYVDYTNGRIYFHSSAAGTIKYVNYYGLGSPITVDEINYLNSLLFRGNTLHFAALSSITVLDPLDLFVVYDVSSGEYKTIESSYVGSGGGGGDSGLETQDAEMLKILSHEMFGGM